MSRDGAPSDIFFTGGVLPPDSLSYVKRPADDELFDAVLVGKLCCIFAPHHMGKSSLMLRTARQLEQRGIRTVTADLASSGGDSSVVQSFQYLTQRVQHQLDLPVDLATWWWVEQAYSDPIQGLVKFLRGEVLSRDEESIVIFLDGIDTSLDSDILDSLLTAILQIHQARETDPVWRRLTFVLIGTNSLDSLIRNHPHFPFRACQTIDLCEFSHEEAQVLQHGLRAACPDDAETTFSRIFYWTSGHPYLTQKLCMAVANAQDGDCTDEGVDGLVERVFLSPETGIEPNLQFAEDSIRMDKRRRQLLSCYRRVYKGKNVAEDEHSFAQHRLKLMGLLRGESGTLKVRNEVYRSAFDSAWIRATMPANWTLRIAVAAALLIILLVGFANLSFSQQQRIIAAQSPTSTLLPTSAPPTSTPTETSVASTSTPTLTTTSTVTPTTEPTATREMEREELTPEVAPTTTSSATATSTPTAEPTPIPTQRPTSVPTATNTLTLTPTSTTSTAAPTSAVSPIPTVPSGTFTLLGPLSLDDPTHGPTDFKWKWSGGVPPGFGFEVRVWRQGEAQLGAHDALLDNQNGNIQKIGGQEYRLNTNIEEAAGVEGRSGVYLWTVALVQVSPSYADLGQQAEPAQLRLEVLGASDNEDTGGVGID